MMDKLTIKELRDRTGMSQRAFAERFGIPVRTLQDMGTYDDLKFADDMSQIQSVTSLINNAYNKSTNSNNSRDVNDFDKKL